MSVGETTAPKPADFFGARTIVGLLIVAADWSAIIGTIALGCWVDSKLLGFWWLRAAAYLVTIWIVGAFQFAIGETLLHDAAHNHLFKQRSWNDGSAIVIRDPFLIDLRTYRGTHLWHHRDLLGSHDYIPHLYTTSGLLRPGCSVFWLVFLRPIVMPLFSISYFVFGLISPRPRMLLVWGAVLGACLYFGTSGILLKYWVVPLLWCFPTFVFWSETADHLYVTGTRSRAGWLANLVFNNNGYHALHHRHPAIPGFRLKRASRALSFREGEVALSFVETLQQMVAGSKGLPLTAPNGVAVEQAEKQSLFRVLFVLNLRRTPDSSYTRG